MAIRDRLTDGAITFTRSELKIVRQLLSNYPAAGLNTVAHLAAAAGVSNPTVVRFANTLGFEGYPEFQKALLSEVQERMSSPLSMLDIHQAEKLVSQLQKAEDRANQPVDPSLPLQLLRVRRDTERAFAGLPHDDLWVEDVLKTDLVGATSPHRFL